MSQEVCPPLPVDDFIDEWCRMKVAGVLNLERVGNVGTEAVVAARQAGGEPRGRDEDFDDFSEPLPPKHRNLLRTEALVRTWQPKWRGWGGRVLALREMGEKVPQMIRFIAAVV